jgi:cytochrome c oxidase assembly protein subunit 20
MSSSTFGSFEPSTLYLIHTTMSDDSTRQLASAEKAFTSDQWKAAEPTHAVKPENANVYAAAASQHTAGGSAAEVTITDAAKSIKIEDFAALPKKPCVRDSLLTGITAGFVVGSSRAIWRGMSM